MPIEAAFFDFDGLLVDTEYATLRAWQLTFADFGCDFDDEAWLAAVGMGAEPYDPSEALERARGRIDWDEVNRKRRAVRDSLSVAMPGARQLLEEARRLSIATVIVSNSTQDWVERQLAVSQLPDSLIDVIVCGAGRYPPKPDPKIFLHAMDTVGVSSENVVTFEDSVPGVRAAKAALLYCVAVPNRVTQGGDFSIADQVVSKLSDVALTDLSLANRLHRAKE